MQYWLLLSKQMPAVAFVMFEAALWVWDLGFVQLQTYQHANANG